MTNVIRTEPAYPGTAVRVGIVHLGLGAFHRAHQAVYIDRWLDRNGGGDWGICAANLRSNRILVEQLRAQDHRYHVVAYRNREHAEIRRVASIREALFAGDSTAILLRRLCDPAVRIVSLSVTEKAYGLNPADGHLRADDPGISHDLANPDEPRTAPGVILAALVRRRKLRLPPFTVLSCDNMPANGTRTRGAVAGLAAHQSSELADWIAGSVSFPSTMVDRIVPAVDSRRAAALDALLGLHDPAAVACEEFSQWVIEDCFGAGRPDWEHEGVEMVADVRPYETMKLRLLNGAHSLLAYVGLQRGHDTVAEAICDPVLRELVRNYFDEAAASLPASSGIDISAYTSALLDRFGNDALDHRLQQIAMDGSQKLPQRWLDGAAVNLENGRSISATARGVAAWMAYVRGRNDAGENWIVDDPLADRLAACHRAQSDLPSGVCALLDLRAIFPATLAQRPEFRDSVIRACRELQQPAVDAP